jgi:hypothetical protein
MCCFIGPIEDVSATKIFARREGASQVLVYSMTVSMRQPAAMVLPLPVPPGSGESALTFTNLEGYSDFFDDLDKPFAEPLVFGAGALGPPGGFSEALEVHSVGAFDASFVPTRDEFLRLDRRFRLPDSLWDALPVYRDYGFAVFKLKPGQRQTVHPMAFRFPTRLEGSAIFFPTLHIHDGTIEARAVFDHALYLQANQGARGLLEERLGSRVPASRFVDVKRAKGLVDGNLPVYKASVHGSRANDDIVAMAGGTEPLSF